MPGKVQIHVVLLVGELKGEHDVVGRHVLLQGLRAGQVVDDPAPPLAPWGEPLVLDKDDVVVNDINICGVCVCVCVLFVYVNRMFMLF